MAASSSTMDAAGTDKLRADLSARQRFIDGIRMDPNLFIQTMMGFKQADLHVEMQGHISRHKNCAVTTHRGAGKTDQISVGRMAWEIGRNPNIRIKIFKNAHGESEKVTDATRRLIDTEQYREIFPNVKPDRDKWSGSRFRVSRTSKGEKEPTYEAYGIFDTSTGGRGDLIVYDDICDVKNSIQNPSMREKVKEQYRNATQNMLVKGGRVWRVYTPYHVADLTVDWERNPEIEVLSRPVRAWVSPWPDQFPVDRLKSIALDIGTTAYARAYELKRVSDEDILIKKAWVDQAFYLGDIPIQGRRLGSIDFAFTKARAGGVKMATKDPDYSVLLVAVVDATGNCYLERLIRVRTTYPEFKDICVTYASDCERVVAEDVAAQRALIQDLNLTTPLNVKAMTPAEGSATGQAYDKRGRLNAVSPMIEAGKVHIPAYEQQGEIIPVPELQPLYDELTTFPVCEHDDTVDALTQLLREVKKRYVNRQSQTRKTDLYAPSKRLGNFFD